MIEFLRLLMALTFDALLLIFLAWVVVSLGIILLGFLRATWLFAANCFLTARGWLARVTRSTKGHS